MQRTARRCDALSRLRARARGIHRNDLISDVLPFGASVAVIMSTCRQQNHKNSFAPVAQPDRATDF